jgi:hypothetical protein
VTTRGALHTWKLQKGPSLLAMEHVTLRKPFSGARGEASQVCRPLKSKIGFQPHPVASCHLSVHYFASFTNFISSQVLHCSTWETQKSAQSFGFNVNVPLGSKFQVCRGELPGPSAFLRLTEGRVTTVLERENHLWGIHFVAGLGSQPDKNGAGGKSSSFPALEC